MAIDDSNRSSPRSLMFMEHEKKTFSSKPTTTRSCRATLLGMLSDPTVSIAQKNAQ